MRITTPLVAVALLLSGCELLGLPGPQSAPPARGGQPNTAPAPGLAPGPGGQLVDCRRAEYRSNERPSALTNRSQRPYRTANSWSQPGQFPTAACTQTVTLRAQAYCQKPHVRYYQKELQRALTLCRAWEARRRAYANAKSSGGSGLLASMTPDQARRKINGWLSWARSSRGGRKSLGYYALVLHHQPGNAKAMAGFDQTFASYYGVSTAVASRYRTSKQYTGRLAAMPKPQLYQLAIKELLGSLHSVAGGQPKLGLSYLDVLYLVERVYLPALRANVDKFRAIQCSRNLKNGRRDFRPQAVAAAMGKGKGNCRPERTTLSARTLLRDDRHRLALIEILAQQTASPADTVTQAALTIARQVGATRTRVCWTAWNPMKIRQGVGSKCSGYWAHYKSGRRKVRRSSFRGAALTDKFLPRHPYYAQVYTAKPIGQLTAMETDLALTIAKKAGATGASLAKQLTRHARRAKKYKCVAFEVTMRRFRRGRGKWSKLSLGGVGRSRDVSCRKVRRNNALRSVMPKRWTNYFDTVRGGKYTGSWRQRRTFRKRRYGRGWYWEVRRTRPAVIYVRRKL
jgi:hypothetical protein